jgi:hypothetical protein
MQVSEQMEGYNSSDSTSTKMHYHHHQNRMLLRKKKGDLALMDKLFA